MKGMKDRDMRHSTRHSRHMYIQEQNHEETDPANKRKTKRNCLTTNTHNQNLNGTRNPEIRKKESREKVYMLEGRWMG